jgi:putative cardiolipin synthase
MFNARSAALIILLAMTTATGCRSLPSSWEPVEPTFAFDPAADGPLADFAEQAVARLEDGKSGFLFVERNDVDLQWRLAMIDSATESLDLQTYLWHREFSGRLFMERMLAAAERGVRVRLLVDDFLLRGRDRAIAALDDHPNIEIKVWNPGRVREVGRNLEYLARLRELNHRLHNKVLIADSRVVLLGGRNVADAYFGLSEDYNFLDLDLLMVGPAVPDVCAMFDRYWNAEQAAPGKIFHRHASAENIPDVMARPRRLMADSPLREIVPLERQSWDALLDEGAKAVVAGDVEVVYDKPGERAPSQDAFFGLQRFMRRAKREVLALNPYLVPQEPFFEEARRLEAKGVHMAIMTNSLGSTNQPIVHNAYSQTRRPMLEAGVDVFEMKYQPALKDRLDTPPVVSEWVGLHAKAMVLDREHVFIGSYNFSPRSRNLNTELGLMVHSPELGAEVADFMEKAMAPENAWQLRLDEQGRLRWESADGTLTSQPSQNFMRRFKNGLFGLFPLEEHL